jgi:hypothetical protein
VNLLDSENNTDGLQGSDSARSSVALKRAESDSLTLLFRVLREQWHVPAFLAALVGIVTFVVTTWLVTPYYQATALIRLVPAQQEVSDFQGIAHLLGGSGLLGSATGGLLGNGAEEEQAQEYLAILRSYQFNMEVARHYDLQNKVEGGRRQMLTPWKLYRLMIGRLSCDYDRFSGNFKVAFLDPNPQVAQAILNDYINSLRERVRSYQVSSATSAVKALSDEAQESSDPLLQQKLYELMARQLEREKTAQEQANFAFIVIDAPVVPDEAYSPRRLMDTWLMMLLAAFVGSVYVLFRHDWTRLPPQSLMRVPELKASAPRHTIHAG